MTYKLTVRHGSRVDRQSFDDLRPAVEAARAAADTIRGEGPLSSVKVLREFESGQRVAGRVEITYGGVLRGRSAGVDVMGDGSLVAYSGGVRRRALEPRGEADAFDLIERELASAK